MEARTAPAVADCGQVAKRSNATDCKSVGSGLRRFESSPVHNRVWNLDFGIWSERHERQGENQIVRIRIVHWLLNDLQNPKSKFQIRTAGVTQLVESQPSKLLVAGSSPVSRSTEIGIWILEFGVKAVSVGVRTRKFVTGRFHALE